MHEACPIIIKGRLKLRVGDVTHVLGDGQCAPRMSSMKPWRSKPARYSRSTRRCGRTTSNWTFARSPGTWSPKPDPAPAAIAVLHASHPSVGVYRPRRYPPLPGWLGG
ncbi:hypothetical protein [Pseudomonas paraeruginosa]|uniref:hypothetical protein n=1 Tax=Pseudomonas paraeruginosa TaxID=2994495 RepID=UPI0039FD4FF1